MWHVRSIVLGCLSLVLISVVLGFASPRSLWAADPGVIEVPPAGSLQSGLGIGSGWNCNAGRIDLRFDGTITVQAAYGTARADTKAVCGDDGNNGFGVLINWNLLGNGPHTAEALADGVPFASANFTVTTLGSEFLEGLSRSTEVVNFPQPGKDITLQWQQNAQNFIITTLETEGGPGICSTKTGIVTNFLTGNQAFFAITNPCAGNTVDIRVATPSTNGGAFFICNTLLDFVQGDAQFSESSFAWKDSGKTVCDNFLPGITEDTTVTLNAGVALNLKASFDVFFGQAKIAEFH